MRSLPLLLSCLFLTCTPPPSVPPERAAEPPARQALTNLDLATLRATKASLDAGEATYRPAYTRLLRDADAALADRLYAVTDKTTVPPSGDKHDYLSLGPYWWPDPDQPDGLPWIRKDGEVNPLTRGDNVDEPSKRAAFRNIETLALAAYFSDDPRYAERALAQVRAWFLAPATRMNPHLEYGQGIPGRNTGRGIGIIETIALGDAITGVEILDHGGHLPPADGAALDAWLTDFADWLMTSEMGIAEREWHNNHGSWYDVQVVVLLRHLGRDAEARAILETAKEKRIAAHLDPDGAQPHELKRTKSLSYSTMNLRSLMRLAYHGRQVGVDLWNYVPADGGGLPAAYAFLRPYVFADRPWPHPQLGDLDEVKAGTRKLFYETGARLELPALCREGSEADLPAADRMHLLYHCPKP